jgi:aminoglycoside 3-N-acetyltransferase
MQDSRDEVAQGQAEVSRQVAEELAALGVRPGGALLVHAGLRALGPIPGGAETVVRGLLAALGEPGTLLMPALSYQHVTRARPAFDVSLTPSNVGALAEYFRTRPGTRRSVHPTHSVCGVGPQSAALLDEHGLDNTPVGPHSPFSKLPAFAGQILMLGCGLKPSTSMHGVEEVAEAPYLFGGWTAYRLTDGGGAAYEKLYRYHGFSGWTQRYDRLADVLDRGAGLSEGRVLRGRAHLIEATALWERAAAALRGDPYYFVERRSA